MYSLDHTKEIRDHFRSYYKNLDDQGFISRSVKDQLKDIEDKLKIKFEMMKDG